MMFSNKMNTLVYYQPHALGYELRPLRRLRCAVVLSIGIVVFAVCLFLYLASYRSFVEVGFFMSVSLIIMVSLASALATKVIFDTQERTVSTYWFGFLWSKHPFGDFNQFQIVKHYLNGIYTGTNVRMKFKKGKVTIGQFQRTKWIENLLTETKLIMLESMGKSSQA